DATRATGVMFNYLVNNRYGEGTPLPVKLKGLDPAARYTVREINLLPGTTSPVNHDVVYTGDFLTKVGINPQLTTERTSVVLQFSKVTP
ncbi:GH36 C-terminal domain-containing protein, partial [Fulvivirgaceae bacterium PWU5]